MACHTEALFVVLVSQLGHIWRGFSLRKQGYWRKSTAHSYRLPRHKEGFRRGFLLRNGAQINNGGDIFSQKIKTPRKQRYSASLIGADARILPERHHATWNLLPR